MPLKNKDLIIKTYEKNKESVRGTIKLIESEMSPERRKDSKTILKPLYDLIDKIQGLIEDVRKEG